ncbi:Uncharacterised protein [Mycobacteroides abscessus subsp. abscessus]|nr:Uncharacterised protein [Mycobacteroides abscessus subsp. abscessus]
MTRPRPPTGVIRWYAPTCAANRPATSLIGASRGSAPSEVCTVSYAIEVVSDFSNACVHGSEAARCR